MIDINSWDSTLIIFFLIGLGVLLYSYFIYPLILIVLSKIYPARMSLDTDEIDNWPTVNFVIAAYNEEKVIGLKIKNCLTLEYPEEFLDIWIASDGSSDKTNEIVKDYSKKDTRIHLLEFPRTGKSGVLNKAMLYIKSDIIVFSDANTVYSSDALKHLVKHFADPQIGCVCGRLIYRNPGEIISGKGESFYWRYETALKKMESKLGYVAGANGAIYAIRRKLFKPFPSNTINDDFEISMSIVRKGYKCIYEENAIAYEDVAPTMESEFKRHVRDGAGHYIAIMHLLGLLNPLLGMKSFIYWSHRILRWIAPFILIFLLLINIFLINYPFYRNIFFLQISFYLLTLVGFFKMENNKKIPFIIYVPFYFCNLNLALLIGFSKVVTGKQRMTWERTERIG